MPMPPAIRMMREMTIAKTGRWMKNFATLCSFFRRWSFGANGPFGGVHDRSGPGFLNPFHDDALARLEALGYDVVLIDAVAQGHGAKRHFIVLVDDVDDI